MRTPTDQGAASQTIADLPERGQKKKSRDGHNTGLLHRSMAKLEEAIKRQFDQTDTGFLDSMSLI